MNTEDKRKEIERKINWLNQQIEAAERDGDYNHVDELLKDLHYFQDKLTITV